LEKHRYQQVAAQADLLADLSDNEERSIAFADADGWRCFYPASRGHLTAAEARAEMRAARGLPAETPEEWEAAEFLLVVESAWYNAENSGGLATGLD
jgi:hypothetical protein